MSRMSRFNPRGRGWRSRFSRNDLRPLDLVSTLATADSDRDPLDALAQRAECPAFQSTRPRMAIAVRDRDVTASSGELEVSVSIHATADGDRDSDLAVLGWVYGPGVSIHAGRG